MYSKTIATKRASVRTSFVPFYFRIVILERLNIEENLINYQRCNFTLYDFRIVLIPIQRDNLDRSYKFAIF